jgi:hypothetical protein
MAKMRRVSIRLSLRHQRRLYKLHQKFWPSANQRKVRRGRGAVIRALIEQIGG